MKNLEKWSRQIVNALKTEDETGDTFLMLDVIDADSVLDLITRCQAAERRVLVLEKALELACIDFKEEYALVPDSKTVSYMIDNYSKKAENALKEG